MMKRFLTNPSVLMTVLFLFVGLFAQAQTVGCGTVISVNDAGGPGGYFGGTAWCTTANSNAAGNYALNANTVTTLCPDVVAGECPDVLVQGQVVTLTLTQISFETSWDAFYIYNGPNTGSPLFPGGGAATISGFPAGGFQGIALPAGNVGPGVFRSTHASGCITLQVRADGSCNGGGYVGSATAGPYTDTNGDGTWDAGEAVGPSAGLPCPGPGAPCTLNCLGDFNVSLSGCNPFTIPDKIDLAWLTGNCPRVLLPLSSGFVGAFGDLVDYNFIVPGFGNPYDGNADCITTNFPSSLTIQSATGSDCFWNITSASFVVPQDGQISFNWSSTNADPGWDYFGYHVGTPANPNSLDAVNAIFGGTSVSSTTFGVGASENGVINGVAVTAGSVLTFYAIANGGVDPIIATISNLQFSEWSCPEVVQLQGPTPGTEVGQGIYNMKFVGVDAYGNELGKCAYQITVTAVQPNLTCNDHLNISVNETCRIALVPDMLLENYEALGPCQDGDFIIKVWPFGDASKATGNVNGVATAYPKGTHTYEITHPYGNKCWGTFTVEDKLAPRIDCGPVRNIQCYEVDALVAEDVTKKASPSTARFAPSWADNCGMVTAEFTTHKLLDGCNGGNVLRKWIVTDMSGNTAYCEQWFAVNTVVEWSCPTSLVVLGCKDAVTPEAIAASRGVAAGFPYFASPAGNTPIHGVCNYYTTYSDVEIDACGAHCHGNRKVIRSWQILDWCNGTVTPCQQIIKAIDTEAPTFIVKDTIISTAPWYCEGDFYVPNPWELHDNCDINPTWSVKSSVVGVQIVPALLNGTPHPVYKYRAIGVPKGTSHLKYTATDCCGNEVTIVSNVTVVDKTPPVPVAKRDIVIGLVPGYDANGVPDGTAKLYSESIDNGSYDNCSAVRLEIRRVNKGVKSDNFTTDAPSCGNLGNGIPRWNNNITFNNRLAANLGNNMPYNTNDTDGGLFVKFCCEDLTSAGADFDGDGTLDVGYHMVIMRVWDDGNMDGTIGNAGDNWNDTWANVKVECKVPPVITCPADATIHCDWAIEKFVSSSATKSVVGVDFKKTGLPEAYGVCTNPAIEFRDREVTDQCGIGFIERTFVIKEKDLTRTCVQIITILPSTSAQPWVTNFPGDWDNVEQIGCDEPTAAQIKDKGPTNVGGPCDVIGVSTKMWLFNFEDGVCKKWKVEYKYVNWCTNEERGPFYKYFMYSDEVAPVVTCRDTMYAVGVNCELSGLQLTKKATDTGGCIDNGWLKWTVIVDLWADGSNDIEYTSFIAPNNDVSNMRNGNFGAIRDDNENGIPDVYLAPTANGAAIPANSIILPTIAGKMSNHKVAWKVTDGCHNFTTCHESFMVADKKAPTPVCIPLSTALMQDPDGSGPLLPMVELWAIDFMNKSYDNCTDASDLLYTFDDWAPRIADTVIQTRLVNVDKAHYFNSKGQAVAAYPARPTNSVEKAAEAAYLAGNLQLWIPENRSAAKVWVAGDIAPGVKKTVDVHVTVWDKKFNHDYCWTTLDLIYNGTTVGSRISGSVVTASNQPVNNVAVTIDANITEYPKTVSTAVAGTYEMEVPVGMNYQITASKGGDYLNGVSTLDLVLIQRHILGIQTLDNPYKLIAADANNDGKVTASDLTDLRKLILGITNELPKNASWRFPVTAQSMDATNPFPFVEQIAISQLLTNMSSQNFVAVKIGDVNGNVSTNVSNPAVEGRSNRNVVMAVAEHTVAAGEVVEIPVTAANFSDVAGYQFTMNLKGGSYVGVNAGALDINASNVGVIAGDVVTMSYASNEGTSINAGEVLFTLIVKADKAGNVSEMITLNSGVTAAESYSSDLTVGKVSLDVRTAPVAGIELNQNEPNPFKGQTTVSFVMPEAATATLSVYDVTGKVVTVRNIDANKGLNSEIFTREQLGATGVLYYTLKSGDFTATKKMIIIE